ncbi:hypothetical protein POTOM_056616 [Populus tomentosa]|uniref:Uncharacterized protein n=1 Tax=Populus tomentosa TaxID=118781 RepID=A0A8X7XV09_POPTO|nr:hypothetical protein POTOM_056616 [Populus tomentosa]
MRKMGSSSVEDIPAMQEIVLEFRAGKMVFYGKKVNQALGRVYILKFNTDDRKSLFGCRSGSFSEPKAKDDSQLCSCVNYYINRPFEFLDEEEPDASTPFQVFEDMLEDNISSRNGNLIVPDLGAEVMSDVTSSLGPMKLEDLQRILSNIGAEGGPRDVMIHVAGSSGDPDEGSLNSRGYFRLVAESSFPLASGFFYLCKKCEADPSCSVSCPFDDSQFYKV